MNCSDIPLLESCEYVKSHCHSIYLEFASCSSNHSFSITILILWCICLFCIFGKVATCYLCPNLATISSYFKIPQSVAGVTLAAFGNGAPDLFSTFSSIQAHSSNLALGELLGAANFITLVVVGSVAFVAPFRIPAFPFLRDVAAFLIATIFILVILIQGYVHFVTSILLIIFYLIYVAVVIIGSIIHHYYKRKRQIQKDISLIDSDFPRNDEEDTLENQPLLIKCQSEEFDDFFDAALDINATLLGTPLHRKLDLESPNINLNKIFGENSENVDVNETEPLIWDDEDALSEDILTIATTNSLKFPILSILMKEAAHALFPLYFIWSQLVLLEKIQWLIASPGDLLIGFSTPVVHQSHIDTINAYYSSSATTEVIYDAEVENSPLAIHASAFGKTFSFVQLFMGIIFSVILLNGYNLSTGSLIYSIAIGGSCLLILYGLNRLVTGDYILLAISFFGFFMSVIWIYIISDEIVDILSTFGIIFKINTAIIGLTVFAIGNSLLDMLTNLGMAKLGLSVMAIGASYGSPMMNIVLGIGVSTCFYILKMPSEVPLGMRRYELEHISRSLYISLFGLIGTLLFTTVYLILNHFRADKRLGVLLIILYTFLTISQLVLL